MDISLPFQRESASLARWNSDQSSTSDRCDILLGEYVGFAIKAGLERSVMGHSDRMKPLEEGASFRVFRSSLRSRSQDGALIATPVVVKMLRGSPYRTDPILYPNKAPFREKQLEALVRETRVLVHPALRSHEAIVSVLEWGFSTTGRTMDDPEDPEWQIKQPFLIVEFAEKGPLDQFLLSHNFTGNARNLALDIASGLEALHSCGIAHGDLKPSNILIFPHPQRGFCAKLSDFGHSITDCLASEYLGSEAYRPPELREHDRGVPLPFEVLLKCDIWSFGTVVIHLLLDPGVTLKGIRKAQQWTFENMIQNTQLYDALAEHPLSERIMWETILDGSLNMDPTKRRSAQDLREVLDIEHRFIRPFQGKPLEKALPTVLEIQARFSLLDEKYIFRQRLFNAGFHGQIEYRSYYRFQSAQACFLGLGGPVDITRALYWYAIVTAEKDGEPSDPTAMSLSRHILGVASKGHGLHADQIWSAEEYLSNGQTETSYARRIRRYRLLALETIKASKLHNPRNVNDIGFSDLQAQVRTNDAPASVTLNAEVLDLNLLASIPLLNLSCLLGQTELIECMCRNRADDSESQWLENVDDSGNTCLQYACMAGQTETVCYLVNEKGMSLDTSNSAGTTLLHWLPFFSSADIPEMARLLATPDSMNAVSKGLRIPFHLLFLRGTPLQWAVSCRDPDAVQALVKVGVNIDLEYNGYTALALAVELHAYDIVDLLLGAGAKVTVDTAYQRSAMHYLAGNVPIIRRQVVHGTENYTMACLKTIRVLERYGCDVNARDCHNNTPLHKAVASPLERGDLYVVKALLSSGADRNAQNEDGDTALHLAVKLTMVDNPNHKALFQLLADDEQAFLDIPINTTLCNKEGMTPHLVGAIFNITGDLHPIIPMKLEDLFGQDNEGNHYVNLARKNIEEILKYIKTFVRRLDEIGLTVGLHPDCS